MSNTITGVNYYQNKDYVHMSFNAIKDNSTLFIFDSIFNLINKNVVIKIFSPFYPRI